MDIFIEQPNSKTRSERTQWISDLDLKSKNT